MSVFRNTKKAKKFILIILATVLFSFVAPNQVMAGEWSLGDNISEFLFWIERGIIKVANNIFCDERHTYEYDKNGSGENTKVYLSPESIIKGKFAILDPNIFEDISNPKVDASDPEKDQYYDTYSENTDNSKGDKALSKIIEGKKELRNTIAGWYYALRNFAIIALLSILVYVGIRMILSTLSQDKAKYKMMLKDWLVALCLVMVMHYIMIGTLNITSSIVDAIGRNGKNSTSMQDLMTKIQMINDSDKKDNQIYLDENNVEDSVNGELYTIGDALAYELVLLGVIGYTLIFAFKYLLRMMTIVFLILVAPITAVTYPIDKISDGKAQAFNTWLQEFIYEVIIQPFHLLIYVVLIGSATTLASTNVLYSIMCFAVMIPAEKFIKQMFGFKDKLGSPLGAFAGGAVASQLMSKAFSGGSSNDNSPKIEGKKESDDSLRESKLKPGLPGADQSTRQAITNERNDNQETVDTREQAINEEETESEGINPLDIEEGLESEVINPSDIEEKEENDEINISDNEMETESEEINSPGTVHEENEELNSTGIYNPNSKVSKFKNAASAIRERRDKTLMAKYGTKNRAHALAKYAGKKGAKYGKKAIKGATTLAGAAALGLVGSMFGQGKAGLAAGATFGAKFGNWSNSKISSTYDKAKAYGKDAIYATKDENTRREEKAKETMKKPEHIENASRGFSKRNNGKIPNKKELDQELEDRAKFKETGLSDSQIDDAMEIYDDKGRDEVAFEEAFHSVKTADRYKGADFEDPNKVQKMLDAVKKQYTDLGINKYLADEKARDIIKNAAGIHGVKAPALPPSLKDNFMTKKANKKMAEESYKKRNGKSGSTQQTTQELEIGYNLKKAGLTDDEIKNFYNGYLNEDTVRNEAKEIVGENATEEEINHEIEKRYLIKIATNLEEKEITSQIASAEKFLKNDCKVENPTNARVCNEIVHRLAVKKSYQVSDSEITKIRRSEEQFVENSTDKAGARAVIQAQRSEGRKAILKTERDNQSKPDNRKESLESVGKQKASEAKYERYILTHCSLEEIKSDKDMEKIENKLIKNIEKTEGKNMSDGYKNEIVIGAINGSRKRVGIDTIYKEDKYRD